jgi:large subunit ribosomal protein L15e
LSPPPTHFGRTNPAPPLPFPQDARINWIVNPVHKRRELRGLTSAGKKYRGLHGKGSRYNKNAPSKRATWLKHNSPSLRRYR